MTHGYAMAQVQKESIALVSKCYFLIVNSMGDQSLTRLTTEFTCGVTMDSVFITAAKRQNTAEHVNEMDETSATDPLCLSIAEMAGLGGVSLKVVAQMPTQRHMESLRRLSGDIKCSTLERY